MVLVGPEKHISKILYYLQLEKKVILQLQWLLLVLLHYYLKMVEHVTTNVVII